MNMKEETALIEDCPNCKEPNPEIEPMPNGECGVCGGTGKIEWKETGYKIK